MLRSLLLAPPGAGKGTQGERIAARYGVPHIATGDLLRDEVARKTPIGEDVAARMAQGELVPDELVTSLVRASIGALAPPVGFVLDGFPRTLVQAEQAYAWAGPARLTFHAVLVLEVPEDVLVERVLERGRTTGRADDTDRTIRRRLQVYAATSEPLLDFYRNRDLLVEIDGTGTVDEVTDRIRTQIGRAHV